LLLQYEQVEAGRADMAEDPRFDNNAKRNVHEKEIDAAIQLW
jgi:crotonobetainyl-CoA:carnitine CoA-transferase CaiB-like acyl-CoA transferase